MAKTRIPQELSSIPDQDRVDLEEAILDLVDSVCASCPDDDPPVILISPLAEGDAIEGGVVYCVTVTVLDGKALRTFGLQMKPDDGQDGAEQGRYFLILELVRRRLVTIHSFDDWAEMTGWIEGYGC